jgi:hypothetical protein
VNNLLLVVGLPAAAYVWARFDFPIPGARISRRTSRHLLAAAGYAIILIAVAYVIGDGVGGRTQVAKSPHTIYAYRDRQPTHFWGQLSLDLAAGLAVGVPFVVLARRRSPLDVRDP